VVRQGGPEDQGGKAINMFKFCAF
jgi:2-oxoisovalerate dehydrogenase E2 component (dihydrolipoyl transacylase)